MKKILGKFCTHPFILFLVVGFIVFSNLLFNNFVWLDYPYVLNNPQVQSVKNIPSLFKGSALTADGYYRPIPALLLGSQKLLFNDAPIYYHFIQILLRIINVYFLFILFSKYFSKKISIFFSLVYLVHPLNVSQVAFISSIADMLFLTFGLLALNISLGKKMTVIRISLTFFFLLVGLLSKEAGILFIFVVMFAQLTSGMKRYVYFMGAGLASFLIYIFIRNSFSSFISPEIELYPMYGLSLRERLINAPKILMFYISKFFIPYNIGGLHLWKIEHISVNDFYFPLLLDCIFLMILSALGIYVYKKSKKYLFPYLFFSSFFILGQVLNIHIIPLDYTVSGRWFSFPMIGLLGMLACVASTVLKFLKKGKTLYIVALGILVYLSVFTMIRNSTWKNNITLFTRWEEIDDNFAIEGLLAQSYFKEGNFANALTHGKKSVILLPYDDNLSLLAQTYEKMGDTQSARATAARAISENNYAPGKHTISFYSDMLDLFLRNKDYENAQKTAQKAVNENPTSQYFLQVLNTLNHETNNGEEGKRNLDKAVEETYREYNR